MNIFFLGAGFSRPAGLPLGDGLFLEILEAAKFLRLYDTHLKYDIDEYLYYYYAKTGNKITENQIKLEEFMSYIVIDRELGLHGGDTSTGEEILRNLIAYVLYNHEIKITNEQFLLYEHFAERLGPYDIVFTFNYDTVLEKTLTRKNIPYRLYQNRHEYDKKTNGLILDWKDEITIFKMHGSIDWFDKTDYEETKKYWEEAGIDRNPPHAVFDGRMDNEIHRLLDDPFNPNDPFKNIYIVDNLDKYFKEFVFWREAPFIIPPSYHKLVSLNYLRSFWSGFSNVIIGSNKIAIIGFSLPSHDEYIRQPLYWYISNFHEHGEPLIGEKSKLKIIDLKKDQKEMDEFKLNYRFANQSTTDFYFDGFCEEALNIIFAEEDG